MEDILASIRRIIAEDPPGSRPAQTAQPAPAAASSPKPMQGYHRPAFELPSAPVARVEPDFTPSQPTLSAEPFMRSGPSFTNAFPQRTQLTDDPLPARIADAPFAHNPVRAEPVLPDPAPSTAPGPAFHVDPPVAQTPAAAFEAEPAPVRAAERINAQLSDLFDDFAEPSPTPTAAAVQPAAPSAAAFEAQSAPMQHPQPVSAASRARAAEPDFGSLGTMPSAAPAPRPGFTVSRIGFDAPEASAPETQVSAPAARDPFDFNIGPSPFARNTIKEPARPAASPSPFGGSFATDIDALIAEVSSKAEAAVAAPAPEIAAEPVVEVQAEESAAAPASTIVADDGTDVEADEPAETDASVEADIEPAASAADVISETSSAPPVAEVFQSSERLRDILPLAPAPARADVSPAPMTMRSLAQTEYLSSPAPAAASFETLPPLSPAQRTAEDALADLLRPMLRTWLAENMPKIVERALRQELAQQTDQKTAAE